MFVLGSLIGLNACGHLGVYEEWEPLASHPSLPAVFFNVDSDRIARECGNAPGVYVHGCAQRDFSARLCRVYTRANPEDWLVEHERKHCAGWDHAALPELPLATVAASRRGDVAAP
jgi:hypothetical protein